MRKQLTVIRVPAGLWPFSQPGPRLHSWANRQMRRLPLRRPAPRLLRQQPRRPTRRRPSPRHRAASPVAAPAALPPAGRRRSSGFSQPCFNSQGGVLDVENETYLYYIQLRPSQPSQKTFVWYDEATEQTMLADFKRLWATNFLDDLSIEVTDHTFANGAVGKIVIYHMEERERVKIVDYRDTTSRASASSSDPTSTRSCANARSSCGSTRSSTTARFGASRACSAS